MLVLAVINKGIMNEYRSFIDNKYNLL